MSVSDLVLPTGPFLIKDTRGVLCRHCHKPHEFISHRCKPCVFVDKDKLQATMRVLNRFKTAERHIRDNFGKVEMDAFSVPVGEPLAISEKEALKLDPDYRKRPHNL